ncbi:hypothetical protein EA472_11065 [Natrarchaeobius oligotrophus]|uniref:Uncharacterized protein n=1 Tax=Natrarchaeobius chitinivorans TaxID=1679083 RepID=A0A3N6MRJ7_NATCH|nr:hypothetical protein EA472_11065 [Natrarchaeobius chitinivorans]
MRVHDGAANTRARSRGVTVSVPTPVGAAAADTGLFSIPTRVSAVITDVRRTVLERHLTVRLPYRRSSDGSQQIVEIDRR